MQRTMVPACTVENAITTHGSNNSEVRREISRRQSPHRNRFLPHNQQVMMPDGRSVPMTDQFREEIIAKYATMAVRPLRCLALATKASGIIQWSTFTAWAAL